MEQREQLAWTLFGLAFFLALFLAFKWRKAEGRPPAVVEKSTPKEQELPEADPGLANEVASLREWKAKAEIELTKARDLKELSEAMAKDAIQVNVLTNEELAAEINKQFAAIANKYPESREGASGQIAMTKWIKDNPWFRDAFKERANRGGNWIELALKAANYDALREHVLTTVQADPPPPTPRPAPRAERAPPPAATRQGLLVRIEWEHIEGGYLMADKTFLGRINANEFDSKSIANEFGYGSDVKLESIFNDVGRFGGEVGLYSPFNSVCSNPPAIYNKDGEFVGWLTVNELKTPRLDPNTLIGWIKLKK